MKQRTPLVIAAIGLIAVGGGWYAWQSSKTTAQPDPANADRPMVEVSIPASFSGKAIQGQVYFDENCAACHGKNAAGSGNGPPLVHKIYEPGHHADGAFRLAAMRGVRSHHWNFGDMPPVEDITPEEVDFVVAYVRELQRANGIR